MLKKRNIKQSAEDIAMLVAKTDADQRGELFEAVGNALLNRMQNYTASIFFRAASDYGVTER